MRKVLIVTCLFIQLSGLYAQYGQTPLLEREVTISAENQTIESVLNQISAQTGVLFSYSPEIIQSNSKVSLSIQDKSVRFAINSLFSNDINYKVKGKYIILKGEPDKTKDNSVRTIEGYIYDSGTGKRLTDASVYDKNLTASAVTDQYGYFRMELPVNTTLSSIQVSKLGYADTTNLAISDSSLRTIEISINSDKSNRKHKIFTFQKIAPLWLVPRQTIANSLNINQSVFKAVQFSLLPTVSTNHFLRGNAVNNVSVNLLAGYVQGVRLLEFGGLVNIVKDDAQYAQFAGIGNVVGNNFKGFQAAGIFNTAHNVTGYQAAGIFSSSQANADFQTSGIYNNAQTGIFQAAGILNIAREMTIQIGGIANIAEKSNLQIAGLASIAENADWQISGIYNKSAKATAMQISGIANTAPTANGMQLSGFGNYVRDTACIQISGFLNRAGYVRKFQLSFINIDDSCAGVPIGFFTFVKKGYHKIEISADEIFPFNAAFRSGVKQFHTIFMAGVNPFKNEGAYLHYGFGIGTSLGNPGKLLFDIDLTDREIFSKNDLSFNNHLAFYIPILNV